MFNTASVGLRSCWLVGILALAVWAPVSLAHSENLDHYEIFKKTKFHRFFVDKTVNFGGYNKIALLPMDTEEFAIASRVSPRLRRSWESFPQRGIENVERFLGEALREAIGDSDQYTESDVTGKNVLLVQFIAKVLTPQAPLNGDMDTVGSETMLRICRMQYEIAIYDSTTRKLVAYIDSDLMVSAQPLGQERVVNNRANQNRGWKHALLEMSESLVNDISKVAKKYA